MTDTKTTTSTEPAEGESPTRTFGRLAEKGEEALRILSGELEKNPRTQQAKDRLGKLQRSTMQQLNIALADEVAELKKEIASLEKRLAKLEKAAAG
jgi:ubiquinone biosynthesis protein UbiJ